MKETLKDLRLQNNANVADIAKILGVTENAIYNYENGIRQISLTQVLLLSDHYGLTADEIIKAQLNSIGVGKTN